MSNSNDYSPEKLKYNFVFFFAESDFWQAIIGKELYDTGFSKVYRRAVGGGKLTRLLFRAHWAFSVNKKVNLPLKSIWYRRMYTQHFGNDKPLCFVYMGANSMYYGQGFVDYVRRRDSRNRQVVLHQDLIAKKLHFDYDEYRKNFDLMVTYDKGEAEQYGIEYFQETTYSKLIPEPEETSFEYDVYFLGAAKDRLPKIHETFRYLTKNGLRCKFIVTGVPKEKQIEGIEYSTGISYEQNLQYILKSKNVLEIIQGGSCDITTRALEAIAYRRRFISDCPLDLTDFFNNNQLCQYEKPQDIDLQLVKANYCPDEFLPKADLNPLKRLYFIQEKLEEKENG